MSTNKRFATVLSASQMKSALKAIGASASALVTTFALSIQNSVTVGWTQTGQHVRILSARLVALHLKMVTARGWMKRGYFNDTFPRCPVTTSKPVHMISRAIWDLLIYDYLQRQGQTQLNLQRL